MRAFLSCIFTIFIMGCTSNDPSDNMTPMSPKCPSAATESISSALELWSCGEGDKAFSIAKDGALREDPELTWLYLQMLSAKGEQYAGLAFAIKEAEKGNINIAGWTAKTAVKYKISTLNGAINKWYFDFFKNSHGEIYPRLADFLDYSISWAGTENSSIPFGLAFAEKNIDKLTGRELEHIRKLVSEIKATLSDEKLAQAESHAKDILALLQNSGKDLKN